MVQVDMEGVESGRHDLFISFHGSEELTNAGLPAGTTTRALARVVVNKIKGMIQNNGRISSIFFDETELRDSLDDIFKAVMQTRGGGVALFLITKKYFTRAYCLAELRAFMDMQARADKGGHVGVKFRFICLDPSVDDLLNDEDIKRLVPNLSRNRIHADIGNRGTVPAVADAIAKMVLDAWKGDNRTGQSSLGSTVQESFRDLCTSLSSCDVANAKYVLGVSDPRNSMHRMFEVLAVARREGIIGHYDVEELNAVITTGQSAHAESQRKALTAYTRKWCDASSWEWGSDVFIELRDMERKAKEDIAALSNT